MPTEMIEPEMDQRWQPNDQMNTMPIGSDNNCDVDVNVNPFHQQMQGNNFHHNEATLRKAGYMNSDIALDGNLISSPNKRKNEEDSAFEDFATMDDANSDMVDDHIMDDQVEEVGVPGNSPSQTRVPDARSRGQAATGAIDNAAQELPALNHSEAGPEVAEFTEEEFRIAAEVFKDPSTFEFLERVSNTKAFEESSLSRLSLYVKFDPLVSKNAQENQKQPAVKKIVAPQKKGVPGEQLDEQMPIPSSDNPGCTPVSRQNVEASKLIDFQSPNLTQPAARANPRMAPVEPMQRIENMQPCKLFTEDDMKKAIQINDLLFQERLIKKDKELAEAESRSRAHLMATQEQVEVLQQSLAFTRSMLEKTSQISRQWQEKKELERVDTTRERDQALEDLRSVEASFSELHRRYEKIKAVLEGYKQNEEGLRVQLYSTQQKLQNQEQMYQALKEHTQERLESANQEIEIAKRAGSSEIAVLRSQLMKAEMKISSLEKSLEQKTQEFSQLTDIYEDLIERVSGNP